MSEVEELCDPHEVVVTGTGLAVIKMYRKGALWNSIGVFTGHYITRNRLGAVNIMSPKEFDEAYFVAHSDPCVLKHDPSSNVYVPIPVSSLRVSPPVAETYICENGTTQCIEYVAAVVEGNNAALSVVVGADVTYIGTTSSPGWIMFETAGGKKYHHKHGTLLGRAPSGAIHVLKGSKNESKTKRTNT